ncbi:MAG TPA: membrane protein insertase YidC [Candidatus Didemnitutus sp.]|nr:membrane protein insertase YidC [Candidatus Didemnitutus sp.]
MDKKNAAIGILLLIAAGVSFYVSAKFGPPATTKPRVTAAPASATPVPTPAPNTPAAATPLPAAPAPAKAAHETQFANLDNDTVHVRLTTTGGAIDTIELKQHKARLGQDDPYTINAPSNAPILSFIDFPGVDQQSHYDIVTQSPTEVVFRAVLDNHLEVTRHYQLLGNGKGDPYQIRAETTFHNLSAQPLPLPRVYVSLGCISPLNENDTGVYINAGYYDGSSTTFTRRDSLSGAGFFSSSAPLPFVEKTAPVVWATVKNQFFAAILTPDQPGVGFKIERVKVNPLLDSANRLAYGLTGQAEFDLKPLAANASSTWGATYFAGPKEYRRLAKSENFAHDEDKVMEFGWFSGIFSKLLLTIMTWVHTWLPSWGWAVVVTTLFLKLVTLPFTLMASRSAKHMQKIAPLLKEIREKYKDNPAKQQEAMMRTYKENGVNPLGGCIPVLITLPFFFGFYAMLQSATDLRFASFLWVKDLAAPDTVVSFGTVTLPLLGLTHLSLNILPLLMGATMIYQMRITPSPSTDPAQAAMMKFMPLVYMLFCYNFAAALALYSTINGLFTIVQQKIVNRLPEPQLPGEKTGAMKNVTPKKRK